MLSLKIGLFKYHKLWLLLKLCLFYALYGSFDNHSPGCNTSQQLDNVVTVSCPGAAIPEELECRHMNENFV